MVARIETRFLGIPVYRSTPEPDSKVYQGRKQVSFRDRADGTTVQHNIGPRLSEKGQVVRVSKLGDDSFSLYPVSVDEYGDIYDQGSGVTISGEEINDSPFILHSRFPGLTQRTIWEPPKDK